MRALPITIQDLALWGGSKSRVSPTFGAQIAGNLWHDSRKVETGDVFVALASDTDDGHNYVVKAFAQGALACIVASKKILELPASIRRKCIPVANTLTAVQKMGSAYRQKIDIPVIGITGSSGKTTTRTFMAELLGAGFSVSETYTNFNNHIGVPLSLLRFTGKESFGVIEMGANHLNEISVLTKVTKPDIGVITNIGYSHVGCFGGLANTTKAKFEIAQGISKNGYVLLNGDDDLIRKYAKNISTNKVFFGISDGCDIRAEHIEITKRLTTRFTVDGCAFELSMPGRHFVYCALPGIQIAREFGIPLQDIAHALRACKPVSMRGGLVTKKGRTFILDCYNANPSSMRAGIDLLADVAPPQQRVAVVGDMLELGRYARGLHTQLGADLAAKRVDRAVIVGNFAEVVAQGAQAAGMLASRISTAPDANAAVQLVKKVVLRGDTVLIKASRGVHLETVFEQF